MLPLWNMPKRLHNNPVTKCSCLAQARTSLSGTPSMRWSDMQMLWTQFLDYTQTTATPPQKQAREWQNTYIAQTTAPVHHAPGIDLMNDISHDYQLSSQTKEGKMSKMSMRPSRTMLDKSYGENDGNNVAILQLSRMRCLTMPNFFVTLRPGTKVTT